MIRTLTRPQTAARPAMLEALEGRQLFAASGLSLVATTSTVPLGVITNTALKGTVKVNATNSLTSTLSGPQTFNVFASSDATLDASDKVVGSVFRSNLKLGAGKTTVIAIPVKSAVTAAGTYDLFIQATDGSGNTSGAVGETNMLTVTDPYVSLTAKAGTVRPTVLLVNHTVTFKVTIVNSGNTDSRDTISAVTELSTDGTTISQTIGNPVTKKATVRLGGKAVTLSYSIKVPVTGRFFVGATFTSGVQAPFTTFSTTPITVGTNAA